jgi:hypothetical protein
MPYSSRCVNGNSGQLTIASRWTNELFKQRLRLQKQQGVMANLWKETFLFAFRERVFDYLPVSLIHRAKMVSDACRSS